MGWTIIPMDIGTRPFAIKIAYKFNFFTIYQTSRKAKNYNNNLQALILKYGLYELKVIFYGDPHGPLIQILEMIKGCGSSVYGPVWQLADN